MNEISLSNLEKALERFGSANIVVVGDVMMDKFIWGKVSRISPEAPIPVVDVQKESIMLGGAGNVAHNLVSLGAKVHLYSVIGPDVMGNEIIQELAKKDCRVDGLVVDDVRPTTVKTRVLAHAQQVVRFDREDRNEIKDSTIEKILSGIMNNISETSAVIVSDYAKGVICRRLMNELGPLLRRKKIFWAADPKTRDTTLLRGATVLTPNQNEAEAISGIKIESEESLFRAGEKLIRAFKSRALLITRGEAGMALIEQGGKLFTIPTVAKEIYDVTGAGDTVVATFTLGAASGLNLRESAFLANLAAGIVVGKIGTATVKSKELLRAIQNFHE